MEQIASVTRLLHTHDGGDVGLEPHAIADELRQLLVHQCFVLLERLPRRCRMRIRHTLRRGAAFAGPAEGQFLHLIRQAWPGLELHEGTQGGHAGTPASLFSLCCSVLMVLFISSSPLARVCGSLSRCFSTCALHRQTRVRTLAAGCTPCTCRLTPSSEVQVTSTSNPNAGPPFSCCRESKWGDQLPWCTLMVSSCTVRRRESTSSLISSSFFIRICTSHAGAHKLDAWATLCQWQAPSGQPLQMPNKADAGVASTSTVWKAVFQRAMGASTSVSSFLACQRKNVPSQHCVPHCSC